MSAFAVIAVAAAAVGVLVGRWVVAILATLVWIAYALGLERGWWGNGVGDGWTAALVLGALAAAFGAIVGVAVRRGMRGRRQ